MPHLAPVAARGPAVASALLIGSALGLPSCAAPPSETPMVVHLAPPQVDSPHVVDRPTAARDPRPAEFFGAEVFGAGVRGAEVPDRSFRLDAEPPGPRAYRREDLDAVTDAGREGLTGFLVLGAASLPSYFGADEQSVVPFAVARVSRGDAWTFELEGLQARLDVLPDPVWRAGPALSLSLPRNDTGSTAIDTLPGVGIGIEAGGFVGFELDVPAVREGQVRGTLSARQDVVNGHGGLLATASVDGFFAATRMLRIGASVETTYADGDYMNAYFGVAPDRVAATGLRAFDPDPGFRDVGASVISILSFSERFGLFGRVAYNRLVGDAANGPIVEQEGDADQWFFGAGLFTRF
jgi:outer membrane protein